MMMSGRTGWLVVACVVPLLGAASHAGQPEPLFTFSWGATLADAVAGAATQAAACAQSGAHCDMQAPTPAALVEGNSDCSGSMPVLSWRHASELSNATAIRSDLAHLATSHEPFHCSGSSCLMVLHTLTPGETAADVSTLSVCRVQVVKGVVGAPVRCEEAEKESPRSGLLLRARVGSSYVGCSMGLRDFDAVFRGRAADLAGVRQVVMDVLAAKPFNLSVMEDRGAIVGTRTQVASDVLKGWREWTTVRVDIDARDADAGTSITTTLLVGKQAASDREAWTPPSEAQEAAYLLALRNEFHLRGADLTTGLLRR